MDAKTPSSDMPDASVYEIPTVTDYGNLTEITAGMSDGNFTDRSFPVNTPKRDLTFSQRPASPTRLSRHRTGLRWVRRLWACPAPLSPPPVEHPILPSGWS